MSQNGHEFLDRIHRELGWPAASEILQPSGAGPRMFAELVRRKLQIPLGRIQKKARVQVGILSRNHKEDVTDPPLAIVCEFSHPVSAETIYEAHRLAWNFSHSPMLITLEPHQIRAWTCYENPVTFQSDEEMGSEIREVRTHISERMALADQAVKALHWVELITGRFFQRFDERFRRDRCADRLLLGNLREVRKRLTGEQNLDEDVCHDLLARIIFIQFLMDRKDSSGKSALSESKFAALHKDGILSGCHTDLESLLLNYDDTYSLFHHLDERFNGDLFPGSGRDRKHRKEEWIREEEHVSEAHLHTLADFIGGRMDFQKKQGLLWRHYSFDVVPLEFISSIYEEFVSKKKKKRSGTVYTPPHLVDFILDGVLPWNDTNWDIKILDPACGSGIFLVKAFQRLVWRWKAANPQKPGSPILKRILTNNLFGVDKDEHAVRVASFSLYLAMCDEIDPKYYWSQVKFPPLRGHTIIASDFFAEDVPGFRSEEDAGTYHLVVGNPPWGDTTVGDSDITRWKDEGWEPANKNIGPIFLPKAAALVKDRGIISLLQPSGLLTNNSGTAARFRRKFFERFKTEEIVNLSVLRFGLYQRATGPSCITTFSPEEPDGEPFPYIVPKELKTIDDHLRILIEPDDIHLVYHDDAATHPILWSAFAWGGHREFVLINRLNRNTTLLSLWKQNSISKRQGIVRGDRRRENPGILNLRILKATRLPQGTFLCLDTQSLPKNDDPYVHSRESADYSAFSLPQLIIKQGWQADSRRFEAAMVKSRHDGIICSQGYISIHLKRGTKAILETICLVLNSCFATFYLTLSSGRMATFIPTATMKDLMRIPLPEICPNLLDEVSDYDELDERVREAFGFSDIEWALIDDLFNYTLPDFKGNADSPGRLPTRPLKSEDNENFLKDYAAYCLRVLKAGFGEDKHISATIFSEKENERLPVRVVAIHLDDIKDNKISVEKYANIKLRDMLLKWDRMLSSGSGSVLYQRTGKVYDVVTRGKKRVPTAYLIKPDRRRYWTRSAAIRDADSIAADIMAWQDNEQR